MVGPPLQADLASDVAGQAVGFGGVASAFARVSSENDSRPHYKLRLGAAKQARGIAALDALSFLHGEHA
jgi:hypothetical protein